MKITIEEEGKDNVVIETNQFFLLSDKGASWNGVETHLMAMLEYYKDFIKQEYFKKINGDN